MNIVCRILVAGSVLAGLTAVAQVVPGRYVVELMDAPALAAPAARSEMSARRAEVRRKQSAAREAVGRLGGVVLGSMDTVVNGLLVSIPDRQVSALASIPGVLKVHPVRRVHTSLSHALPLHKVTDAWASLQNGSNSAGAGIKIAMIDTGISVEHPGFSGTLPALSGFPKALNTSDLKFTNSKIIVANNYTTLYKSLGDAGDPDADDHVGHGTGTAMVAAGFATTSSYGVATGVAPQAYLGNYHALDGNGGTSDVIAKAIDDAVADGMDIINLSVGAQVLYANQVDGSDVAYAAISTAAKAGVVVVVAAGNDGPGAETVEDYGSNPDAITAGAISNDRSMASAVVVDGAVPYAAYPGDGPDPGAVIGKMIDVTQFDSSGLACSSLPGGSLKGKIVLILRGTCPFEAKANNAAAAGAVAAVIYNSATGSLFDFGTSTVGAASLPTMFMNAGDGLDLKARIANAPTLGGTVNYGSVFIPATTDVVFFSSRGPSFGGALKPDLVAVGNEIVTAVETNDASGELYDPSGFLDLAGTSFSTPLVAGAAALVKSARPGLTVSQYRSLLVNSAGPATIAPGKAATVQQAGAGVLNVLAALQGTMAVAPTALNFGTSSGAVNNTLALSLTNVGASRDTFNFNVMPTGNSPSPSLSLNSTQLDPNATASATATLNASGLAPGEYQGYIQISGASSGTVATIPYWFAVTGSTVASLSVIYADSSDSLNSISTGAVTVRLLDAAGLPYTGSVTPTFSVSAGPGSIRAVYADGDLPGTYSIDIRTGNADLQITATAGAATTSVIIPVF